MVQPELFSFQEMCEIPIEDKGVDDNWQAYYQPELFPIPNLKKQRHKLLRITEIAHDIWDRNIPWHDLSPLKEVLSETVFGRLEKQWNCIDDDTGEIIPRKRNVDKILRYILSAEIFEAWISIKKECSQICQSYVLIQKTT